MKNQNLISSLLAKTLSEKSRKVGSFLAGDEYEEERGREEVNYRLQETHGTYAIIICSE
jgi:hypothetical protein